MELKAAQEITLKMLADLVPPNTVDLHAAGVMGGQACMEGLWNFDFTPDMAFAGFTPDNSGMLRIMALGESKVLLIETASLCRVSAEQDSAPVCSDLDYIEKVLLTWSSEKLHRGSQKAGDILYVP